MSGTKKILPIFLLLLAHVSLWAQQKQQRYENTLIIGDLLGRTDYKDIELLTPQGSVNIFDPAVQKVFRIIRNSEKELVLQLKQPATKDSRTPRHILFRFFDSEMSLVAALITNEVDFAMLESEDSAIEISNYYREIRVLPVPNPPNTVEMVCYNNRHPVFENVMIRKALSYAIDKERIKKKLLRNAADLARCPLNPDSPLYAPSLEGYKYNPRKSLKILNAEGWYDTNGDGILEKDGKNFQITLLYEKGLVLKEKLVRWIKINWNEIGIDVRPKPCKKREIKHKLSTGDFDAVLLSHQFSEDIESFEKFFSSKSKDNFIRYNNPTVDNYINLYKRLQEAKSKKLMLQGIQKIINMNQPVTFLYFKWLRYYFVNHSKFDNYLDEKGALRPYEEWKLRQVKKRK